MNTFYPLLVGHTPNITNLITARYIWFVENVNGYLLLCGVIMIIFIFVSYKPMRTSIMLAPYWTIQTYYPLAYCQKYEHTISYPQLNLKHRNESLCLFAHSGVQHIMYCVFVLVFFVLLPVSLDCPFLIAPSVFSNVYLLTIYLLCLVDVFCNRQSTFLWVQNNWCSLLLDWFLVLYREDFMIGLTNQNKTNWS
jgi:hypothetical protein